MTDLSSTEELLQEVGGRLRCASCASIRTVAGAPWLVSRPFTGS